MLMLVAMLMLVLVGVMVLLLVDAVDGDEHAAAPYAALDGWDELHAHAGYAEGVHARDEIGAIALGQKLQERGGEHIPRAAHMAVQVKYLHAAPHRWLIMLAR